MQLTTTLRVRTYELDSFGHVNNAAYLNYLEEARSEYLKQIGVSFLDFATHNVQFVIAEIHITYKQPARYGDNIRIDGTFRDFGGASVWLTQTLTNDETGTLLATAETKGVFIAPATGRPTRPPEPFYSAFRDNIQQKN